MIRMKHTAKWSVAGLRTGAALAGLMLGHMPAWAQTAGSAVEEEAPGEIVVTAQRRSESLQNVPIAAVALTGANLAQRGVQDMRDLALVSPSLKIDTPFGNTAPKITLRGVGSGSFNLNTETTVALYVDELVMNPVSSKLGQLFDVDRVEVLRGPQGTLYGKNSTGGAVNYITRKPDGTTAADASLTVARYGEYSIQAGAQTGLTDALSVRIAANRRYRDGYQHNNFTGRRVKDHDDWGGRITLRYDGGAIDASLKLFADRSRTDAFFINTYGVNADGSSTANGTNPITGFTPSPDIDSVSFDHRPRSDVDNRGVALNLEATLGELTLTSVSGYLRSIGHISQDQDGSPVDAVATEFNSKADEYSQEIRLASDPGQPLNWIVGASAFHQDLRLNDAFLLPLFGLPPVVLDTREKTTSFAAFADTTWKLDDRISLIGGIRITTDKKSFRHATGFSLIGPFDIARSRRWTEPSYRVGINYQAAPSTLLYLSYNRGYRSGAFDVGFPTTTEQFEAANPEFVDAFEGGIKTALFDRRLRLAADVFYEIFKDQQLLIQRSDPGSICCSLVNAGKSRIYGFELDGTARIASNVDLTIQGSVIRSKYLEFMSGPIDYSGTQLANVPRYQLRLAPEVRLPLASGDLFVSPDVQFTGRQRAAEAGVDPFGRDIQESYVRINGQLGYRDGGDRFSAFVFVRNATNKRYKLDFARFTAFGYNQVTWSEPRSWGLTVTGRF